jgi:hypothetical protein
MNIKRKGEIMDLETGTSFSRHDEVSHLYTSDSRATDLPIRLRAALNSHNFSIANLTGSSLCPSYNVIGSTLETVKSTNMGNNPYTKGQMVLNWCER